MSDKKDRRGLGRGLSALMADVAQDPVVEAPAAPGRGAQMIPIERIAPNPDQPRRDFPEDDLQDLTNSVREKGVIQPLIVRPAPDAEGHYQIVAGERRWRAAQRAQLHELPVVIRDFTDTEVLEIAIIENIQRSDLNAIEEAMGYQQLMDRFGHTQEKLAEALGKSRSHIANLLRLLNLPKPLQDLVRAGDLSAGHARVLVTATDPHALALKVMDKGLSVRETERLAKEAKSDPKPQKTGPKASEKDADTVALEGDLSANLGMPVKIDHKPGGEAGTIRIDYKTLDDLDELCRLLTAMPPVVTR